MKSPMPFPAVGVVVAGTVLALVAPLAALSTHANASPAPDATAARTNSPTPTESVAETPTTPTTPTKLSKPTRLAKPPKPPKQRWHPEPGVIFNEPRKAQKSHVINSYIRAAIKNSPKGSQIRLVTWNYNNPLYVSDLINAHKRGVSVRIIMANGLAEDQGPGSFYGRTKVALEQGNKKRSKNMTSWFRTCRNSCRGKEGIQHGKWFLFSRTGRRSNVVMSTSANLTDAAAYVQWNDLLTIVNRPVTWANYKKIFRQMSKDKPIKKAFYTFADGRYLGWFFPNQGAPKHYNVMRMLDKVRCKGAVGEAGSNGHTVIRVSQAVFNGSIGTAVSGKLKGLQKRGCRIKLVFGVLNNLARENLKNVPKKTILEDTNGDGYVDRYIHMKALTISGVYDGKRSAHIVYQGSANWSGMSTYSDEQGFIVQSKDLEKRYSKFIEYLYKNPPPQGQDLIKEIILRQRGGQDPFKYVREEMGLGGMRPAL